MTTMSDSPEIELLHRATAQAYLASKGAPVAPVLSPPLANHNYFGGE